MSLEEQHRKRLSTAHSSSAKLHEGTVVLLILAILSRNDQRLLRIVEAPAGADGVICEAKLRTAIGRIIRRSINLIVSVKLDYDREKTLPRDLRENLPADASSTVGTPDTECERYNLGKRRQVSYNESSANHN
ncbi:hypothetical protein Aduo_005728 [Ancylostoma duodenale]